MSRDDSDDCTLYILSEWMANNAGHDESAPLEAVWSKPMFCLECLPEFLGDSYMWTQSKILLNPTAQVKAFFFIKKKNVYIFFLLLNENMCCEY